MARLAEVCNLFENGRGRTRRVAERNELLFGTGRGAHTHRDFAPRIEEN